jgi:membrane protein DedA with SNARE-associated domain
MTDTGLPGVFGDGQPLLEHYGYLGVGGMLFLEDFGVPVPGEIMLIAAAVLAGAGQMNIAVVFLVGVLAAVIGDNIGFIDGLRQINGLLAGIAGMHWLKFLGYNALGAVLWVGTWCGLGYLAGENIVEIYDTFERYKWYVIGRARRRRRNCDHAPRATCPITRMSRTARLSSL